MIVQIHSGGVDSWVVHHKLTQNGLPVRLLHVDYGQTAARMEWLRVPSGNRYSVKMDLLPVWSHPLHPESDGVQLGVDVELSARNLALLSQALVLGIEWAKEVGDDSLSLATGFDPLNPDPPLDVSEAFIQAFERIACLASGFKVNLLTPLSGMTKAEIYRYALDNGCDLGRDTWSCYDRGPRPCGVCWQCVLRKRTLGAEDTTPYLVDAALPSPMV